MKQMLFALSLVWGIAWPLWAAESPDMNMVRMPGQSHQGPLPPADTPLKTLAQDLRRHVEELATRIGERNVQGRSRELAQAAKYIEIELTRYGYQPQRQEYGVADTTCCNVEVEIRGTTRRGEIVIVGAHYDSALGTPGANDNATGVAALLALAQKFSQRQPERSLRFVAFTNEEPPYFQTEQMGSLVYARRCRQRGEQVQAMLSLETMGCYSDAPGSQNYPALFSSLYPATGNFIAFIGNTRSLELVRNAAGTFRAHERFPAEGGALPDFVRGVGFSDHWSFWQADYPGLMVTDTAMFRYAHYHEAEDTPDKVNFDRLARVVRGLDKVIAQLTGSPAQP